MNEPVERTRTVAVDPVVTSTRTVETEAGWLRDGARWGPVLAGFATAATTILVLTVLGLAVGLTAFEPGADGNDIATGAGIWGAATAVFAFLVGGWMAGRTAGVVKADTAALNGFLTGAVTLLAILWMTTTGLANVAGWLGANIQEISQVTAGGANADPEAALRQARAAYDEAEAVAWGSFAALIAALAAAVVGAMIGHATREPETASDRVEVRRHLPGTV